MLIVRLNPAAERSQRQSGVWVELRQGARYVLRHPAIRALLLIIAVASVFGRGALEMMPAFADSVYQRGSVGLAILTSAIGGGAIVTGLALSRGTNWLNIGVIMII